MALIEDWASSWFIGVLEWYAQTFMIIISPEMLLVQLELLVLIYLVLQILGFLFPIIKRITTTIFLPFRLLHVWLHLEAAKKLGLQTSSSEETLVISRFLTSVIGEDRVSLGIKAPQNTKDAYRIATAPTRGAIVVILLSFVLSPLLFLFGLVGFLIHLYLLLGSLTTLWTDAKDYLFVYQTALINADLSPRYIAWTAPIFIVSFLSTLVITTDIFKALLSGISFTAFYLLGLLWFVARTANQKKETTPPQEPPLIETSPLLPFPRIMLPSLRNQ
ncbi:MAG: hypothetical protein ACFFC7_22245 [Candidatus Hermodarchaeota archaeon]